jgi:hypothetical protein
MCQIKEILIHQFNITCFYISPFNMSLYGTTIAEKYSEIIRDHQGTCSGDDQQIKGAKKIWKSKRSVS